MRNRFAVAGLAQAIALGLATLAFGHEFWIEPSALRAVREAMQLELNAFHFYRMARERIRNPQNRIILE